MSEVPLHQVERGTVHDPEAGSSEILAHVGAIGLALEPLVW
jgi:hypothetical protein